MQARQLGSYELIRRLGEGGMARVYLARDVRLGREVALKVLEPQLAERPGFRERFLREARVAASLDHPHIVPLYDFGESDSLLYLVMPYVSGGSLQDILKRAPLPVGEVVAYGSQIADALDYAHQRKVVHRDVKPANMLVHSDGRLMLSDFGLAKVLDKSRPNVSRGRPDAGTPEYMAPEQIEGQTDERSDIYALGVVLYLLLTGHLPFTGPSSSAVMDGHLYQAPRQPRQLNPAVTPAVQMVVLRALAKNPDSRFQRAGDLSAALLAALVAGNAEPLPFALESDYQSTLDSLRPSPVSTASPQAPRTLPLQTPPAPLPWELPDWTDAASRGAESGARVSPRMSSRPTSQPRNGPHLINVEGNPLSDLPRLDMGGGLSTRIDVSPGTAAGTASPVVSAVTHGRMPLAGNLVSKSPAGSTSVSSLGTWPSPQQYSAPSFTISHVTGPYPVTAARSMPPMPQVAAPTDHNSARAWMWVLMIIAVVAALVAFTLLLQWLSGNHSIYSGYTANLLHLL